MVREGGWCNSRENVLVFGDCGSRDPGLFPLAAIGQTRNTPFNKQMLTSAVLDLSWEETSPCPSRWERGWRGRGLPARAAGATLLGSTGLPRPHELKQAFA